ncbi:MAG TPA: hypothetical protein VGM84_01830 [Steroidobacteraceae bacterium]|jgi:peptidoglycan biosynthesis protein MviN/MurJ (putative lipid II flippase)
MDTQDLTSAISAVFILGMIWIRTRTIYSQRGRKLRLQKAGRIYFAAAVAVLVLGWLLAPRVGTEFWPATAGAPTVTRVIWFMVTYYVFIFVHRYLKTQSIEVFKPVDALPSP